MSANDNEARDEFDRRIARIREQATRAVISESARRMGLALLAKNIEQQKAKEVPIAVAKHAVSLALDAQPVIPQPGTRAIMREVEIPDADPNRVWCEQCDAMVQRGKASHCRSKFCSVRP